MNLYRFIRLLSGLYFILYPCLPNFLSLGSDYTVPFRLAALYLLILEFLAFLVLWKNEQLKDFVAAHFFWRFNWPHRPTRFEIEAPEAKSVHIRGGFNSWSMTKLIRDTSRTGWWKIDLKLKDGEYKYLFCIDRQCLLDPQCEERGISAKGRICNIKEISDTVRYPKAKIDVRNTFGQALIIIAGFVLAFISKDASIYINTIILLTILSIISGLLYAFIFSGGIASDSNENMITVGTFHEAAMEICLNAQVVLLIISLSLIRL